MKNPTKIITTILFLSCFQLNAQITEDRSFMEKLAPKKQEHTWDIAFSGNDNELKMLFSGFFLFYKNFVSSQDASHCSFSPSCSVYAIASIKKKGVIIGMLDAFDRLSRCNGLSIEHYTYDKNMELLLDPVH